MEMTHFTQARSATARTESPHNDFDNSANQKSRPQPCGVAQTPGNADEMVAAAVTCYLLTRLIGKQRGYFRTSHTANV